MTTDETDFETYARQQGLLGDPSDPFKEELADPLLTRVMLWAINEAGGTRIDGTNDRRLSKYGVRFCLQHDIPARLCGELVKRFHKNPSLLLLFVHWRTREFSQKLLKEIESGQESSSIHPDEWTRYEMEEFAGELDQYFEDARLVWMIDLDRGGLVRRVPAEAQATYARAVAPDDIAASHLTEAWQAAFGAEPDPESAFLGAVKAVEATFKSVISPANDRATAGTMADDLEKKPDKWQALLPDRRPASRHPKGDTAGVHFLANALRLLYQCRRAHGDDQEHDANTLEDAQAACFLASSLIAMQRNGFLTQKEKE